MSFPHSRPSCLDGIVSLILALASLARHPGPLWKLYTPRSALFRSALSSEALQSSTHLVKLCTSHPSTRTKRCWSPSSTLSFSLSLHRTREAWSSTGARLGLRFGSPSELPVCWMECRWNADVFSLSHVSAKHFHSHSSAEGENFVQALWLSLGYLLAGWNADGMQTSSRCPTCLRSISTPILLRRERTSYRLSGFPWAIS